MLEHLAGRPNLQWRRNQILLVITFWTLIISRGNPTGPRALWIRRFNRFLGKFTPWQIIATSLSAIYAIRNADSILGLGSPEPLANLYSPEYYRATWITTAFDTAFATAMNIRPKFIRDILSILFTLYYLVYAREADEKLRRFRATCTVEMLRTTWEKTSNPYVRALSFFDRPRIPIVRQILLARPNDSKYKKPVTAWLFFSRSERELAWATDLILDFPGGGFVSMNPQHHEERLRRWAIRTGKPVLALDYGKAPEYPYPWAIEECFDTYRALVESGGRAIGMSGHSLNVIMSGDSAGGNLVATVMYKILEHSTPIPHPTALVFAYPALDFNFTSWMTPNNLRVLQTEERSPHVSSSVNIKSLAEQKDHFAHKRSPLSVVKDVRKRKSNRSLKGSQGKGKGKEGGDLQGKELQRNKSWAKSLSGRIASFASAPLSPVTKLASLSSSSKQKPSKPTSRATWAPPSQRRSSVEDDGEGDGDDAPIVTADARTILSSGSSSSGSNRTLVSRSSAATPVPVHPAKATKSSPTPFRTRLLNRVREIDSLEVNTDVALKDDNKDKGPAEAAGGGLTGETDNSVSLRVQEGNEGDAEDDDDEDDDDEDYDTVADKDKPLSARVLYSDPDLQRKRQNELSEAMAAAKSEATSSKKIPIGTRLTMTSRAGFFQDRIISPSMMRAMAILYIGPKRNPDFLTDYYLSPILAPSSLLARFPPILVVAGEKDPFIDDTVIFGGRIREAKRARKAELLRAATGPSAKHGESLRMSATISSNEREQGRERLLSETEEDWVDMRLLEGWGHGFLQMSALLPESRTVINEIADWIGDAFLNKGVTTPVGRSGVLEALPIISTSSSGTKQGSASVPLATPNGSAIRPSIATAKARSSSPRPSSRPSTPVSTEVNGATKARRASNLTGAKRPSLEAQASFVSKPSPASPSPSSSPVNTELSQPLSSETENDSPLTFTPRKKRTPPSSFGASGDHVDPKEVRPSQAPIARNRDFSVPSGQVVASSPSSSGETINIAGGQLTPPPPSSEQTKLGKPAISISTGTASSPITGAAAGRATPLSPPTGAVLLTEAELLRRRRQDAVFGMGDLAARSDGYDSKDDITVAPKSMLSGSDVVRLSREMSSSSSLSDLANANGV